MARRVSVRGLLWAFVVVGVIGVAPRVAAQTRTATVTQWDIFAATGGDNPDPAARAAATRNVFSIGFDSAGTAGPSGSVWVVSQSPNVRLGRLDGAANTYTEWPVFNDIAGGSGVVKGVTLNPTTDAANAARGDIWMSVAGNPAFILKLRNSNTFRKFVIVDPLTLSPEGITATTQGHAYAAVPESSFYGGLIARVPRTAPASGYIQGWASAAIQPRHVQVDTAGRVWFTSTAGNTIGRLDTTTNTLTEWALGRSNPTGLQLSGSQVCVVTGGIPPIESGEVQCLEPSTNRLTRFQRSLTPGGWVDYPREISRNSSGELFITEQRGNAVLFLGTQAYSTGEISTVPPTTRTLSLVDLEVIVVDYTVTPVTYSVPQASADLRATDIGNGWVRFPLPAVPQTDLEALDRYPQPAGITKVFNDGAVGLGTVFVADAFDGPLGTHRGARVGRFELLPPAPKISLSDSSVTFTATVGDAAATPATRSATITNTGDGTLQWTAVPSDPWIHVLPASGTSIADPSTLSISVDVPASAGTLTGSITITAPGVASQTIAVTFDVAGLPAEISLGSTSLAFTANRGSAAPAAQAINLTNSGGEPLVWSLNALPSWLQVSLSSGTLAAGATAPLSFTVNHAALAQGPYSATVTVSDPNASNPSESLAVSLTVTAPTITLGETALTLTTAQGSTASATVTVNNTGDGALTFTPSADAAWLSIAPAGPMTVPAGGSVVLTVTAGSGTLAAGVHNGSITVGSAAATNGPYSVAVALTVNASGVITLAPASISLVIDKGVSTALQAVTIGNSGGASLSYTAEVSGAATWLSIASGGTATVAPNANSTLSLNLDTAALALGTHTATVQVTATGAANSPQAISVSVQVKDTAKPVLTLPGNQIVAAAGPGGATVNFAASATDDSGTNPAVTCTPASGTGFTLGTTTVNCSASDAAGNTATGSFTVTVRDQSLPVIIVPANITLEATGAAGAVVTFAATATDSVDTTPTVVCTPASGAAFAVGTRSVSCTATDDAGNSASAAFTVTIQDTTPPVLSLPANIAVAGTGSGAVVAYIATATDIVSGSLPVTCAPSSGSTFPVGTTTVSCSATDAAGRTRTGSFTVTVTSAATFTVTPGSLYFKTGRLAYCNGVAVGPNWKDQGLVVTNTGATVLTIVSTTATTWVKVPVTTTIPAGATVTLTVSVNLSGLGRGIYQGSLTLSGNSGAVTKNVPVTLEIGNALPTLCLTPTNTPLGTVKAGKASSTKYFDVMNVGDDALGSWTVTKTATQGTVTTSLASGTGPKTMSVSVKAGTTKGNQSGKVTINAPGAVQSGQAVNLTWTVVQ